MDMGILGKEVIVKAAAGLLLAIVLLTGCQDGLERATCPPCSVVCHDTAGIGPVLVVEGEGCRCLPKPADIAAYDLCWDAVGPGVIDCRYGCK